jgi:hypothetical protein
MGADSFNPNLTLNPALNPLPNLNLHLNLALSLLAFMRRRTEEKD